MTSHQQHLLGTWVHSHEEDAAGEMVFRPASYPFPLSRGRRSFELAAGGDLTESGPGPADRTQRIRGRWTVNGDELTLSTPNRARQQFRIVKTGPDRLVLRELDQ